MVTSIYFAITAWPRILLGIRYIRHPYGSVGSAGVRIGGHLDFTTSEVQEYGDTTGLLRRKPHVEGDFFQFISVIFIFFYSIFLA